MKYEYNNMEIIERLSDAMGVTKDIDLAEAIGESQSKVASWKRIKSPPFASCFEIAMQTGKSIEWLLLGTENVFASKQVKQGNNEEPVVSHSPKTRFSTLFFDAIQTALDTETLYRGTEVSNAEIKRLGVMLYNEVYTSEQVNLINKDRFAEQFLALLKKALNAGTFKLGNDVSNAELKRNGIMLYHTLHVSEAVNEADGNEAERV